MSAAHQRWLDWLAECERAAGDRLGMYGIRAWSEDNWRKCYDRVLTPAEAVEEARKEIAPDYDDYDDYY